MTERLRPMQHTVSMRTLTNPLDTLTLRTTMRRGAKPKQTPVSLVTGGRV
jgi:hypothetical protein